MKAEQFIKLIENPLLVEENQITDLERLVQSYPYFQSANLLYTKALGSFNHLNYHQSLKKASAIAGDRKVLFRLIKTKGKFETVTVTTVEKQESEENSSIQKETELNQQSIIENIEFISNYEVSPSAYRKENYQIHEGGRTENKTQLIPQTVEETPEVTTETNFATERKSMPHDLDDLMAKALVNAYYEKEVLKVTEINKGLEKTDQTIQLEKANFDHDQHNFSSWLKVLNNSGEAKPKEVEIKKEDQGLKDEIAKSENKSKTVIIDKIINEQPKISKINPDKTFFSAVSTARESVLDDENLVTETLARIYHEQGNHAKAIRSYEILSLKFPKKSTYFATLIKEIKNKTK